MTFGDLVTAEAYDRMPEEVCRRVEIVGGRIIASPPASPRHRRSVRLLANAIEAAAPRPWQVTTGVDLRLSDTPLHNRRPDVLVFSGDPDRLPLRPPQVLLAVDITTDVGRLAQETEYATARIPNYWRLEAHNSGFVAHLYRGNDGAGTFFGTLKVAEPFPLTVDLGGLG